MRNTADRFISWVSICQIKFLIQDTRARNIANA